MLIRNRTLVLEPVYGSTFKVSAKIFFFQRIPYSSCRGKLATAKNNFVYNKYIKKKVKIVEVLSASLTKKILILLSLKTYFLQNKLCLRQNPPYKGGNI